MSELAARLEVLRPKLAARVRDEVHQDPFWLARFGERGRRFIEEDATFHVSFLVQALVANDPSLITGYARWLRTVLTARGMCSLHLAEDFDRLGRAIVIEMAEPGVAEPGGAEVGEAAAPALEMLSAARRALDHADGPGRALSLAAERVAERVLATPDGAALGRTGLRHLLSYLADAVALRRPERFEAHVRWLDGWLRAQPGAVGRDPARHLLRAIGPALTKELVEPAVQAAASEPLLAALHGLEGSQRRGQSA